MSLITIIIYLALLGLLLWAIFSLVPMPAEIQKIIMVVVIVVILLWLLQLFGGPLSNVRIGSP